MSTIAARYVLTPRGAFAVEEEGSTTGQAMLMIVGLGLQLDFWPRPLIAPLTQAGLRIVRLDNRDAGLSRCMDELGTPSLPWLALKRKVGLPARPPYTLRDMSDDCLAVLDEMQIHKAHVVGISMGGMIAQHLAARAPDRVITLTSIMSSSGEPSLPGPSQALVRKMLRPLPKHPDQLLDHLADIIEMISSPAYPTPRDVIRRQLADAIRRSFQPRGVVRQLAAIISDRDRPGILERITSPTLVVHGKNDPLLPPACGADTARRIRGAQMQLIDGMGHDLAEGLCPMLVKAILEHIDQGHVHSSEQHSV